MKRGKDDDKSVEPMFPRLHVNDTERGGPRAPPRNKMALYEQLSIPSQRFNSGMLPNNPNSSNSLNPPSSSQGSGHERAMLFPRQLPSSVHRVEELNRNFGPSVEQTGTKRRQEDDFTVPIFSQPNMTQDPCVNNNGMDRNRPSPFSNFQKTCEKGSKQLDTSRVNRRQEDNRGSEGKSNELVELRANLKYSNPNQSCRERSESPPKQFSVSSTFKHSDHPTHLSNRLNNGHDSLQPDYREESQTMKTGWGAGVSLNHSRGIGYRDSSIYTGDLQHNKQRSPSIPTNDAESREDARRSVHTEPLDIGDDVSENSMVDSMSGTDLCPDDVVGIIGQKHFWKARRAIVNQQRVFAVQVFELHRLIKVQKLIAESPHILLEDAFIGKHLKGSSEKKNTSDCIVKTTPKTIRHNDVSEKPDNRLESSAENAVEKTSISLLEKDSQPLNYGSFSGNPPPIPAMSDTNMSPWGFNQPSGHQWLIPVMTPTEGLVYKPYPAPGFVNPTYGPQGSTPVMGNYPNYGLPAPQYPYQGLGPASFPHPSGHGYFPPFGMPVMHPPFAGPMENMEHFNVQNQASCNVPSQKNVDIPKVVKLNPSKTTEVQLSTASSPSERKQKSRSAQTAEKTAHTEERSSDALPLFPTSPVVNQVANAGTDRPTRVIKVVPHNARSATESVARIFQSIQEERRHHDGA
ncbi:hypothetical protein DCAR_0100582 [Daucus carota subsp. sativus]|uniref:Protein EARLY FLOWERING 3 n=1 Tax=Daucus carota subsp. sativus TaxID=79200 RepID=A0AAF1AIL8_DAUCS|nr:PREDICTED: protein EARLY FLOWERING 3 [Daucus carota subsp. sativus]WOG81435.1 hypothetical protein DCAR_0100582 [Daucus carota subsp. sativus]